MPKPTLQIVVASTREVRVGEAVARWVDEVARERDLFDVELVDLAAVGLPLFDEPNHPRLGQYVHEHTRAWSATVARADAFVFVMPEYNHSFNAALKNAIDHLFVEWQHKPVGLVSYGGAAGGARAVAMLKPVLSVLKMIPITEGVLIPFVHRSVVDGVFQASDFHRTAAVAMLDQVARMVEVLSPLRTE